MKTLFENSITKIGMNRLMKDLFINAPVSALIFISFISIVTWTKPNINWILIFILVFVLLKLFRTLIHNYRNHLEKISIDYENEKIIINHIRPSTKKTKTVMNLKEIKISEIKHVPISWFSFENYFWISDQYSKIKISTAGHEKREINLNDIYSELSNM
ncbi:conserved protein of unknown function [Tenacibaculum sp. 190524A02b]|uniref:hypothetical protein n=1 Tax=Tenacibaculum vairaonense TaxID=3137860 RepID=UPI0032B307A8